MALSEIDLIWRSPLSREQGAGNGGRMSTIEIINNTPNNVFPNVYSAQRENGNINYQWAYALAGGDAANADVLVDGFLFLFHQPSGDEYICFCVGDQLSTAGDYGFPDTDTERKYGPAELAEDVSAGETTLTLTCKTADHASGADVCWVDGDNFFVTDKALFNSTSGNLEKLVVSGSPALDPDGVTITISFSPALVNGYAAGAVVASYPAPQDVSTNQYDSLDITGISGTTTVDIVTAGNVVVDSLGALEMTWTFTMSSATTFDVTTDYPGIATLPSGNTGVDYTPQNDDVSRPYATFKAGWISNGEIGDSFSVQTHPPALCMIQKKVVPAGAAAATGLSVTAVLEGEA
jgi:hypothetical protein